MQTLERDAAGRPTRARDDDGAELWRLQWRGDGRARAWLRLPGGEPLEIAADPSDDDPVLGSCVAVIYGGRSIARVGAIDWSSPRFIPAIDRPGALPAGAGTSVLDLVATVAQLAGIACLRYRGPYPTTALFDTLQWSFAVTGDRAEQHARFVAALETSAMSGCAVSPEVDFVPAPHRRWWPAPRVCVQAREEIERVWLDARPYERGGEVRTLTREGDELVARVSVGGVSLGEVARLDAAGRPLTPIASSLPVDGELDGLELPRALVEVLAEVIAQDTLAPFRDAARAWVLARVVRFGDPGLAAAAQRKDVLLVHAALAPALGTLPPARSLALLAAALRDVVLRGLARELA